MANDGFTQTKAGLSAGSNYVVRVPIQYERDRQAWPLIRIVDETNGGATIVDFYGPRLVDIHTGANNSVTLINANGHFPQSLVGAKLYNITDGSSTTITAVSGDQTTITGVLAGGTDNDWDTNDVHMIVPPHEDSWVWCEQFCYKLPEQRAARGQVNFTGLPLDAETVTIRGQAYTFKNNVAGPGAGVIFVKIGATANATADNLSRAIDGDGVAGVNYSYGVGAGADANVVASVIATDVTYLEAAAVGVAGNAYGLVEAATNVAVVPTGGTFYGGVDNDCASTSTKVLNANTEGAVYAHQVESQSNLIDGPSLELGAGNPWIPDGWTNDGLDAGDTEAEAGTVHSGAGSMEWNTGAVAGENVFVAGALWTAGIYYAMGGWFYGDGTSSLNLGASPGGGLLQYSAASKAVTAPVAVAWSHVLGVWRALDASFGPRIPALGGAVGDRFTDDIYMVALDAVSLTCTPASEANSTETTGLQVGGLDACVQSIPAGRLKAKSGRIRWRWTPRHGAGDAEKFGNLDPRIATFYRSGTNYFDVRWLTDNSIQLRFYVAAVATASNWDATGLIVAGTTYSMEVRYTAVRGAFLVDGIERAVCIPAAGIDWGVTIPSSARWGRAISNILQGDATFAIP